MRKLILFLIGLCATAYLSFAAIIVWVGLNDDLRKVDVALVLGSKVELDGSPSDRLQARLDKAVELYKAGYFPKVIVSGGTGIEGYDEARVMHDYLVTAGVPSEHIIQDPHGDNTYASAVNTHAIMLEQGLESVMVISQYFHILRSRLALETAGINEIRNAHANLIELRDLYAIAREVVANFSYSARK